MHKRNLDTIEIGIVHTSRLVYGQLQISSEIELTINSISPYDQGDIVDFELLKMSVKIDGAYHIFNCTCGVPQCAGYSRGILISSSNGYVYWEDQDSGNKWIFDKETIEIQVERIDEEISEFEKYFYQNKGSYQGLIIV